MSFNALTAPLGCPSIERSEELMRVLTEQELLSVSGGKKGFGSNSGQGNLDNDNVQDNSGTTTESGPRGVLKNDNTDNPNYTLDLPGRNR